MFPRANIVGTQPDDELDGWEEKRTIVDGETAQQVKGCHEEVAHEDSMVHGERIAREKWTLKH